MITALSSRGQVYLSLLQSNSNSNIMKLYFKQLTRILEAQDPGFRKTHIIQMDNAKYHRSKETLALLEDLQLPLIFTGPYSYDAGKSTSSYLISSFVLAPCELLFAHFKKVDINPRNVKTGKQ